MKPDLDDQRWEALESRDPRFDGHFVYAVRTTGVYCRPTCQSRRPNRGNVTFHDDPEAAERAGFRACQRCQPSIKAEDRQDSIKIAAACSRIRHSETTLTLADLAESAGLSSSHFQKTFKRAVGLTPREYAMSMRTEKLRETLPGAETVAGAIFEVGYGSIGRAYDRAADELGMTPARFRAGGRDQPIRFASAECSMGWLVVASTELGLCWIELGDSKEVLEARLFGKFPRARWTGNDPVFEDRLRQVVAMVEEPGIARDLPLDVRGTAFQRRVWEALKAIPVGSTATYAEVARSIDRPSAARAVAQACASNCLAVAIPCHRVIRGDGGLGGYRWGVDRKRTLLEAEASTVPPGSGAD